MIPTIKYAWLTVKHKAFVFRAGLRTRAPLWRLLIHDWSKLTLSELPHYGRQFFGAKDDPQGFAAAWLHHQNVNPHHWEYWIGRSGHSRASSEQAYLIQGYGDGYPMWIQDVANGSRVVPEVPDDLGGPNWKLLTALRDRLNGEPSPLPMPEWAVREMVADWMGASRAYEGRWPDLSDWKWLKANRPKMRLHKDTDAMLCRVLAELTEAA